VTIVRTRRTTDNAGADAVIAAVERHANENGYRVVIAVVDPSGELIAMHRTEGAQVASSRVAVDKARTAAIFIRPSREMEEQVTGGRLGALALHGASCLTGGIPLKVDGELVGAVGTSGETPRADHHRPGEALEGHQDGAPLGRCRDARSRAHLPSHQGLQGHAHPRRRRPNRSRPPRRRGRRRACHSTPVRSGSSPNRSETVTEVPQRSGHPPERPSADTSSNAVPSNSANKPPSTKAPTETPRVSWRLWACALPVSRLTNSLVSVGYVFVPVASTSTGWCSATSRSLMWTRR